MIKKFNIYFYLFTGVCLVFLAGCASSVKTSVLYQDVAAHAEPLAPVSGAMLPLQEKLVYQVKWLGITAGQIVAEIKGRVDWKGRDCYLIEVTAKTSGFVSSIYRVDDFYRSYFDVRNLHTLRHEERRHEGSFYKDAVTDFDHQAGKAYFSNAADNSHKVFDIPAGIQDTITASYAARLLPLEPGKFFAFKVCNSEKVYDLFATVTQRHKISHAGRAYDVLRLVPFARLNGHEVREGRVSGFLTDDGRKIPLLVVIKAPVFTQVTAMLEE